MKYIVLILHGYDCKSSRYSSICESVAEFLPGATVLLPRLPMGTISLSDPDAIVNMALSKVDAEWENQLTAGNSTSELGVIIIGHSTGALLARKLYVVACGENAEAPFERAYNGNTSMRPWANRVEKVILFAGMNRGWTINPHLYTKTAFLIRLGVIFGNILQFFGLTPLPFKTRRGAPFITQLRIQWLTMLRKTKVKNCGAATVIQLLGTKDDIISPEDNVDMITGGNFIYLEVPGSNHLNVLNMKTGPVAPKRKAVFRAALTSPAGELKKQQFLPSELAAMKPDESVTDVVFVIHGIRDTGYWTEKVARRVKANAAKYGRVFATETSTYGYFAMLPFLLSYQRRKKVEWLMDQYTENMAWYPNARFSFVGHSNGTYLLARALKEYPACRFKHVVFAGSVVECTFDWQSLIATNRIEKIYNFVASSDWVVAIFPKFFQTLSIQDLGSGGFDGFTAIEPKYQVRYVAGGHGSAIEEEFWDEIAHFIVTGEPSEEIATLASPHRSKLMKALGAIAPVPFIAILAVVILIPLLIIVCGWDHTSMKILLGLYCIVVWRSVTTI